MVSLNCIYRNIIWIGSRYHGGCRNCVGVVNFTKKKNATTNAVMEICRQRFEKDHMFMCEAGIANLMAMSGILSARLASLGVSESIISQPSIYDNEKKTK